MNYLTKLNEIATNLDLPEFSKRVATINQLTKTLDQHKIPVSNLPHIEVLPDEEELLFEKIDTNQNLELKKGLDMLNNLRQYLSLHYGLWSISNKKTCELVKNKFNLTTGLEIMAGNAMWSRGFSDVGVKMISTDDLSWSKTSQTGSRQFFKVENLAGLDAVKKYQNDVDFIIFAWSPNFGIADLEILNYVRTLKHPPVLLMIGEVDGATNSPEFWREAKLTRCISNEISKSFESFDFIDEELMIIE